jgi:SAM-dependent methyltransferase
MNFMDNVLNEVYEEWFFRDNIADSLPMAKYLAPKIKEYLNITSVFDVGCATGHWLSCFEKEGCEIFGLEGTTNAIPYMMVDQTKIDIHDLREPYEKIQNVDLVYSIEVAEHIEPDYADNFVDALTRHGASYILLTAAPPGQGGHGHYNLQYKSYWIKKFKSNGYEIFPEFRDKIVEWCKEARETSNAPIEYRRVAVEGDGTGLNAGVVRNAANWETHEDAMEGNFDKLSFKRWDNIWIPFWFPQNMIALRRK